MSSYVLEGAKWGDGAAGTPGGQVAWSFAERNYQDQAFEFDFTLPAEFQGLVRKAFERWEEVADIDFVEVADSASNNIRLGFDYIDGLNNSIGEASYSYRKADADFGTLTRSLIRFEHDEGWRPEGETMVSGSGADFYVVALHEIGHAIGLGHVTSGSEVMNPTLGRDFRDLFPGDMAGAIALYGPADGMLAPGEEVSGMGGLNGPVADDGPVYRFYQTKTGAHFYTTSMVEKNWIQENLKHFDYEGAAWATPGKLPETVDVFRFYDRNADTHFFTTSILERDTIQRSLPHFDYEGVAFQAWSEGVARPEILTLERFFNTRTGHHHFALPGEAEQMRMGSAGSDWIDEGPGFRVSSMPADLIV